MRNTVVKVRPGFSLVELLTAIVIVAIIGAALTRLMIAQSNFYNRTDVARDARSVSRAALNVMLSDLRMVDVPGGVVAASRDSIRVRVPFAFGVVCTSGGGSTTISLLPVDSVMYAESGLTGYAVRNPTTGAYTYYETSVSRSNGNAATCTGVGISTLTNGKVVQMSPDAGTQFAGTPVYLYKTITYKFASSSAMSGRMALWRNMASGGVAAEELVAPFDTAAKFRFYVLNRDTAQNDVPSPLTNLRGLELVLTGQSERAQSTDNAQLTTAVFFRNRLD